MKTTINQKKRIIPLLAFIAISFTTLLVPSVVIAQSLTFTYEGRVVNKNQTPVSGVEVTVYDSVNAVLESATTDSNGEFSINFRKGVGSTTAVRISSLECENILATSCTGDIPIGEAHPVYQCIRIPNWGPLQFPLCSEGHKSYEHCGVDSANPGKVSQNFNFELGDGCVHILDPEFDRGGTQYNNSNATNLNSASFGSSINAGTPLCGSNTGCIPQMAYIPSSSNTKVLSHDFLSVQNGWLDLNYDDSSWQNANSISPDIDYWSICEDDWIPNAEDHSLPIECKRTFTFLNPFVSNGPQIISFHDSEEAPNSQKMFIRQKFYGNLSEMEDVYLYSSVDNYVKIWIDGNPFSASQDGNLGFVDDNVCASPISSGYISGVNYNSIKHLLNPNSNEHIITANLLNENNCETNSNPYGIQFLINILPKNNCWAGGYDQTKPNGMEKTDNTLTFWMEYTDTGEPDFAVEDNQAFRNKLIILKKDVQNKTLVDANVIEPQAELFITQSNINSTSPSICLKTPHFSFANSNLDADGCHIGDSDGRMEIIANYLRKFENNNLRVGYKIQFLKNQLDENISFPSGEYNIYSQVEYIDPDFNIIPDNFEEITPLIRRPYYQKINSFNIDNNDPDINVSEARILGHTQFGIDYGYSDNNGSGLKIFDAMCYSNRIPFSMILDRYTITPNNINIIPNDGNIDVQLLNQMGSCFGSENANIASAFIQQNNLSSEYTLTRYQDFEDLVIRTENIEDNACNVAYPKDYPQILAPSWYTTYGGDIHSDEQILYTPPVYLTFNGNYYLKIDTNRQPFYNKTNTSLINLSSFGLGASSNIAENAHSYINTRISSYTNLTKSPELIGSNFENWYDYMKSLTSFNNNGLISSKEAFSVIGSLSSFTECKKDKNCVLEYTDSSEEHSITNLICDAKAVIFINGNLKINGEIRKNSIENGCIFVVNGRVNVKPGPNEVKDRVGNGIVTSPYDILEAFFIIENGSFTVENDYEASGNIIRSDALLVDGGIVVFDDFLEQRNLGLRNNIQPAVLITYNPSYLYIMNDLLTLSNLSIRAK